MAHDHESTADHHHDEHASHPAPMGALLGTFIGLLILTVITVWVAQFDLGGFNLPVALLVAGAKGALVVAFFMHLWWDSSFNTVALLAALVFVGLLIGGSILDTAEYRPRVREYRARNPVPAAAAAEQGASGSEAAGEGVGAAAAGEGGGAESSESEEAASGS